MRFDRPRRERFLRLLAVGTVAEAAAAVGVSRSTVARYAARGRRAGADAEAVAFARAFDAGRPGIDAALEAGVRCGSVEAAKLLRAHRDRTARPSAEERAAEELAELERADSADPFCRLPGDPFGAAMRARRGEPLLAGDAAALAASRGRG